MSRLVVDASEEVLDVSVQNVIATLGCLRPQRFQRIGRAPPWPKTVRARTKVRLEDRLHDQLRRHLHHPVSDRRNAQRSLFSISLRNVLPLHRRRSVLPFDELGLQRFQKRLHASLLDIGERLTIDTRRTLCCAALVSMPPTERHFCGCDRKEHEIGDPKTAWLRSIVGVEVGVLCPVSVDPGGSWTGLHRSCPRTYLRFRHSFRRGPSPDDALCCTPLISVL